jgi:hypothetical protein
MSLLVDLKYRPIDIGDLWLPQMRAAVQEKAYAKEDMCLQFADDVSEILVRCSGRPQAFQSSARRSERSAGELFGIAQIVLYPNAAALRYQQAPRLAEKEKPQELFATTFLRRRHPLFGPTGSEPLKKLEEPLVLVRLVHG